MNMENLKSLLLTSLVVTSLILTWSLWTYQPNGDFISGNKVVQDISIGSKRDIGTVIQPKQIIYHNNSKNYASTDSQDINLVYKEIQKGEIVDFSSMSTDLSEQQFTQLVHGEDKIEIIFPTKIPIQQLSQILQIDGDEIDNVEVDRLILQTNSINEKAFTIYFVKYNEKVAYKATLKNMDAKTIKNICNEKLVQLPTYFSYKVADGRIIYLPYQAIKKNKEMYIINQLNPNAFKNAFFTEPEYVKKDVSNIGESYIDGTRILRINYQHQYVEYINSAISSNQHSTSGPLIQKSIDFINAHSGWTAPYHLFSWNGFKGETIFRLYVNNAPVFNRDKISAIRQKWGEEDVIGYSRALFKINSKVESRSEPVSLLSGEQVRDIIKNTKGINTDLIKDIFIGYELKIGNANNRYMYVEPIWVIDYEDYYKKIVIDESNKGGEIVGLESN